MQVKVFFCFPASEVPTAGSPGSCRNYRPSEVPTLAGSSDADLFFSPRPLVARFPFNLAQSVISLPSPSFLLHASPPFLLSSPPSLLAPPPSLLLAPLFSRPLFDSPDCPYSIPPPSALVFPRIGCGLDVGVEEIPLVEEIALVDWFLACVFVLRLLRSRSKVLPWRRTLTPMYLAFSIYSFFLSTPLSPLFGSVL